MSAPTDLRAHVAGLLAAARARVLEQAGAAAAAGEIVVERPKQATHGDYACSLALQLAKTLKRNPRELAAQLVAALPESPHVERTEIAGAGFINFHMRASSRRAVVHRVLAEGPAYGRIPARRGERLLLEFVSANPTGPLHVGHGRGAAYGASLGNILDAAGFEVTREYYINDAGRQMDILALSTWLRYLELRGQPGAPFPGNAYRGDYVEGMARDLAAADGERYARAGSSTLAEGLPDAAADPEGHLDGLIAAARRLLGDDYARLHAFVLKHQMADLREDLAEFGVAFDSWYSEQGLFDRGEVERTLQALRASGHTYEKDGALWFRSTEFGDEKDRVLRRENGLCTYFASDIAYHLDKFSRGYGRALDVWGADHHGYIPRVRGALRALGADDAKLDIALVQFAVLYRGTEKVSMSTRAGEFVTLRELRAEVGNDAARFFYVLRKSDQHLDFDLELAKSKTNENPVYYVQYAHARVCSVLEQWGGDAATLSQTDLAALDSPHEAALLARLAEYPEIIASAAREYAPHLLAFYLKDLAADFHSYYNATRFLVEDSAVRDARIALALAVRQVIAGGLALLGVSAPEKM